MLNENPEVLRVVYKKPKEVLVIHGDWNVQFAMNEDDLMTTYRKAIHQSCEHRIEDIHTVTIAIVLDDWAQLNAIANTLSQCSNIVLYGGC